MSVAGRIARCTVRPANLDELEEEMNVRFPDEGSLADAWRDVRGRSKAALQAFNRAYTDGSACLTEACLASGGTADADAGPATIGAFPTAADMALAAFTQRYSSLGTEYAAIVRQCGATGPILDLITGRALLLPDELTVVEPSALSGAELCASLPALPLPSAGGASPLPGIFGEADQARASVLDMVSPATGSGSLASSAPAAAALEGLVPWARRWVVRSALHAALCQQVLANCSGSGSIALSNACLHVRPVDAPTAPHRCRGGCACLWALLPPTIQDTIVLEAGFADYSVAETGARLWAGAVALSLLCLQYPSLLLCAPTTLDLCAAAAGSRIGVELGCGAALASCAAASIVALAHTHAALPPLFCSAAPGSTGGGGGGLPPPPLLPTDLCAPIVLRAARNVRLNMRRAATTTAATVPENAMQQQDASITTEAPLQSGGILNFFDFCVSDESFARAMAGEGPSSSPWWAPLVGTVDLIVGSDVVYDFTIGAAAIATVRRLLRPPPTPTPTATAAGTDSHEGSSAMDARVEASASSGAAAQPANSPPSEAFQEVLAAWRSGALGGIAVLCCEAHRDGMAVLPQTLAANGLRTLLRADDAQALLPCFALPADLTESQCTVIVVALGGTATSAKSAGFSNFVNGGGGVAT